MRASNFSRLLAGALFHWPCFILPTVHGATLCVFSGMKSLRPRGMYVLSGYNRAVAHYMRAWLRFSWRRERSSLLHCWNDCNGLAGPSWSQEPATPSWIPTWVAGTHTLGLSSAAFRDTFIGSLGWKMEQLGLVVRCGVPDAGITNGSFTNP